MYSAFDDAENRDAVEQLQEFVLKGTGFTTILSAVARHLRTPPC
jgi:hypothetical protein